MVLAVLTNSTCVCIYMHINISEMRVSPDIKVDEILISTHSTLSRSPSPPGARACSLASDKDLKNTLITGHFYSQSNFFVAKVLFDMTVKRKIYPPSAKNPQNSI